MGIVFGREQIFIFNRREIVHAHAYYYQYKLSSLVGELNGEPLILYMMYLFLYLRVLVINSYLSCDPRKKLWLWNCKVLYIGKITFTYFWQNKISAQQPFTKTNAQILVPELPFFLLAKISTCENQSC